jgi:hypothetical protein
MNNRIWISIVALQSVLIGLLLIYLVLITGREDELLLLESGIEELSELNNRIRERNDSLSMVLQQIRINGAVPPLLDEHQLEELKKAGLNDPVREIRESLVSDPDLISSSPVLGGKMGFYFYDGIHILNNRWVLAYFEDGHLAGSMVLRYQVDGNGGIKWEVVDEYIDL